MKKLNAFFIIGTVGMVVNATLHIIFALILKLSVSSAFLSVYPVFISFLIIGFAQIIQAQKKTLG